MILLTDEDRALLRQVFTAARAAGWRHQNPKDHRDWTGPDGASIQVYTNTGVGSIHVYADHDYHHLETRSVAGVVGFLTAIGVLPALDELEQLCVKLNQYGAPGLLTDGHLVPFLGKRKWLLLRSTADERIVSFAVEVSPDRYTTVAHNRETNTWAVAR